RPTETILPEAAEQQARSNHVRRPIATPAANCLGVFSRRKRGAPDAARAIGVGTWRIEWPKAAEPSLTLLDDHDFDCGHPVIELDRDVSCVAGEREVDLARACAETTHT